MARWNTRYAGTQAFCQINSNGYLYGCVDGQAMLAHRVAWAIMSGDHPPSDIDHINGDRADNRWKNLRLADRSQNARNRSAAHNSTSYYLGVSYRKDRGVWRATIGNGGRQVFIGNFKTEIEAAQAYDAAAQTFHGSFARLNFP